MQSAINTALLAGIFIGVWWGAINSTGSVLSEILGNLQTVIQSQINGKNGGGKE